MNKQSSTQDIKDIEGFEVLEKQYQAVSTEEPDLAIDKQIIAAAHRELANPNARPALKVSWWRRLMLPIYAAATFTFTAFAAHWLWPGSGNGEMPQTLPGTAPATVSFEVSQQNIAVEQKAKQRTQRELPKKQMLMAPPEMPTADVAANGEAESISDLSQSEDYLYSDAENDGSAGESVTVTGARSKRSDVESAAQLQHVDKEVWARQIIELFKQGQLRKARQELIRFKRVHPDYPIDEQVEAFRR